MASHWAAFLHLVYIHNVNARVKTKHTKLPTKQPTDQRCNTHAQPTNQPTNQNYKQTHIMADSSGQFQSSGAARRRRERRLRSRLRHEQQSIRMAMATVMHHSYKVHAENGAPRSQDNATRGGRWVRGARRGQGPEAPTPQEPGTQHCTLDDDDSVPELGGSRPDRLADVRPQEGIRRHTVEQMEDCLAVLELLGLKRMKEDEEERIERICDKIEVRIPLSSGAKAAWRRWARLEPQSSSSSGCKRQKKRKRRKKKLPKASSALVTWASCSGKWLARLRMWRRSSTYSVQTSFPISSTSTPSSSPLSRQFPCSPTTARRLRGTGRHCSLHGRDEHRGESLQQREIILKSEQLVLEFAGLLG